MDWGEGGSFLGPDFGVGKLLVSMQLFEPFLVPAELTILRLLWLPPDAVRNDVILSGLDTVA